MYDENNLKIASWIAKQLKGTIHPREEEALKKWLLENESHQSFYKHVLDPDYLHGRLEEYENYSLKDLKERIMPLIQKKGRQVRFVRRMKQIAVVLWIALIVGSVFLFTYERSEKKDSRTMDIMPGKECAVLEMADGRRVELGTGKHFEQWQQNGMIVTNDSNRLSYKQIDLKETFGLEYNTIIIPRGGEYQLTLSDGSRVWLNSDTRLRYPVNFSEEKRQVYLDGEAYFEVSHSEKPFEVYGGGQKVQVLGTSFNVMAYREESLVQTTLVTGSVRVVGVDLFDKEVLLTPGQQAEINKNDGDITIRDVNVENYIGWKDKLFIFNDETMENMMRKLARWYDVDIIIESAELKKSEFYGVIRKYEHISKILDMLKKTQNISYSIEGKKIVIKEA